MKIKIAILLSFFIIIAVSCKPNYAPFENAKQKRHSLSTIKQYLKLNDEKIEKLRPYDSINYQIVLAIEAGLKPDKINPKIDSLLLGKYTSKETYGLIYINRFFPNSKIEMLRESSGLIPINLNAKNLDEVVAQIRLLDKEIEIMFNKSLNVKKDSINKN